MVIVQSGCISIRSHEIIPCHPFPKEQKRPAGGNPKPVISAYSAGIMRLFTCNCRFCPLFSAFSVQEHKKRITQTLYQYLRDWMAPQVGLEPTTLRLTAECSAIELLRIMKCGSDLLSRAVSSQVPSACWGLTSVFGMGTGGTPRPLPPQRVNFVIGRPAP